MKFLIRKIRLKHLLRRPKLSELSKRLLDYASQNVRDCYGRGQGHDKLLKELSNLTLKQGKRVFRLKDCSFFEFKCVANYDYHLELIIDVQKDYLKPTGDWRSNTQDFTIFIPLVTKKALKKLVKIRYMPEEVLKPSTNEATICSSKFKSDSIINIKPRKYRKSKQSKIW